MCSGEKFQILTNYIFKISDGIYGVHEDTIFIKKLIAYKKYNLYDKGIFQISKIYIFFE